MIGSDNGPFSIDALLSLVPRLLFPFLFFSAVTKQKRKKWSGDETALRGGVATLLCGAPHKRVGYAINLVSQPHRPML